MITFEEFQVFASNKGFDTHFDIPVLTQTGEPIAFRAWKGVPKQIGSETFSLIFRDFDGQPTTPRFTYHNLRNEFGHNYVGSGQSLDDAKADYELMGNAA